MCIKKVFCEKCNCKVNYIEQAKFMVGTIDNKEHNYVGKIAYCENCGEELSVSDIDEYNSDKLNSEHNDKGTYESDLYKLPGKYAMYSKDGKLYMAEYDNDYDSIVLRVENLNLLDCYSDDFLRVKIIPPQGDIFAEIDDKWMIYIDNEHNEQVPWIKPNWFKRGEVISNIMDELKKWAKTHIFVNQEEVFLGFDSNRLAYLKDCSNCTITDGIAQICGSTDIEAQHQAIVLASDDSIVSAEDNCLVIAQNNSTITAGGNCLVHSYTSGDVSAMEDSVIHVYKTGSDQHIEATDRAVLIINDRKANKKIDKSNISVEDDAVCINRLHDEIKTCEYTFSSIMTDKY